MVGAELAVRDDLGHGLGWGLDISVGGGSATPDVAGVAPIRRRSWW